MPARERIRQWFRKQEKAENVERGREILEKELRRLGIALCGPRHPLHWTGKSDEPLDFYDLKGIVETLLGRLRVTGYSFAPAEHPTFQRGRVATLRLGETDIGVPTAVRRSLRDS